MRILQINCVFPYGSTGRIVEALHLYASARGNESIVCYGRGKRIKRENVVKISGEFEAKIHSLLSRISGVDLAYSLYATKKLLKLIQQERPDVVHLHCLNGHFVNVYALLDYLKENKIKTILTLHSEIMHTAGCEHAYECEKWKTQCFECERIQSIMTRFVRDDAKYCFGKMKKAFERFSNLTIVGVSRWITERAEQSGIFAGGEMTFCTVHNGIATEIFKPNMRRANELKSELGLKDEQIILHVTPNFRHELKGGKYVLEIARRNPKLRFVIVGYNETEKNLPNNVITVHRTSDPKELAAYYTMADVTLLTSKRETFSMVCAESLCCGTPVVGFMAGGPETIALEEYTSFVPFGEVEQLELSMKKILSKKLVINTDKTRNIYDSEHMAEKYYSLYMMDNSGEDKIG